MEILKELSITDKVSNLFTLIKINVNSQGNKNFRTDKYNNQMSGLDQFLNVCVGVTIYVSS